MQTQRRSRAVSPPPVRFDPAAVRVLTEALEADLPSIFRASALGSIAEHTSRGAEPSEALLREFEPQAPPDWGAGLAARVARARRAYRGPLVGKWREAYLIEMDLLQDTLRRQLVAMAGIDPEALVGPGSYRTPLGDALAAAFRAEVDKAAKRLETHFQRIQAVQKLDLSDRPGRSRVRGERA